MSSNLRGNHVIGSDYHGGRSSTLGNNQSNSNLARKRAHRGFRSSISSLFDDERVSCSGTIISLGTLVCFMLSCDLRGVFLL